MLQIGSNWSASINLNCLTFETNYSVKLLPFIPVRTFESCLPFIFVPVSSILLILCSWVNALELTYPLTLKRMESKGDFSRFTNASSVMFLIFPNNIFRILNDVKFLYAGQNNFTFGKLPHSDPSGYKHT